MQIFTNDSILDYVDHLRTGGGILRNEERVGLFLYSANSDGHRVYIHAGDTAEAHLIVVDDNSLQRFERDVRKLERVLQRIHRVAREFCNPPVSLPLSWRKFQASNRVTFFALPRNLNEESLRWIAEKKDDDCTVFWELTSYDDEVRLEKYIPDEKKLAGVKGAWRAALSAARGALTDATGELRIRPSVDLEVIGASAVSRERPYSQWLAHIDDGQRRVLEYADAQTLKIRGVAGTGKTLTLQLKALQELYRAFDTEKEFRILYLTHSWALADLVHRSIRSIDERGLADSVEIWPLMMAREVLHGDLPEGVEIVGEDGLEGKRQQLSLISAILDEMIETDWLSYKDDVGVFIAEGVQRSSGDARVSLCWMLIREFAEVMDAHQIKPGRDALARYLRVPRAPWMVQLDCDGDKRFFYGVFRRFVNRLAEEGQMTTDQAFDDFRHYLEGYAWNIRRSTEGFDLVLVDEFHLFSDSERYLLSFLTKDPSLPPRMILALDPQQSPFVLLTGLTENSISRRSGSAGIDVGLVELKSIHRFSVPIYRLVVLIQRTHPAILDEGDDWTFTLEGSGSVNEGGDRPVVMVLDTPVGAVRAAIRDVREIHRQLRSGQRVALIAAGVTEFDAVVDELGASKNEFTILNSRDEAEQLNYVRKSIVLASSLDCAGLQFSHVVVLIFSNRESIHGRGLSATRAAVTEFYLAASRAEHVLHVISTSGEGTVPNIIDRALQDGVVELLGSGGA